MARIVRFDSLEQFAAVNLLSDPGAIAGPVVVPQCAQITLTWLITDGKTGHNVLYGRYSGVFAGTVTQANAILTALTTGGSWTALAAFMPTTVALSAVSIRDVNTAEQALIVSTGSAGVGSSASPALPDESALVATIRTALAGRRNRGRMYIPGFATNALGATGLAAAGAVTAAQNWVNTITGAMNGSGYVFVLGQKARAAYTSPTTGRQFPARPATSTTVASLQVNNRWDSQRRRGLK